MPHEERVDSESVEEIESEEPRPYPLSLSLSLSRLVTLPPSSLLALRVARSCSVIEVVVVDEGTGSIAPAPVDETLLKSSETQIEQALNTK